MKAQSPQILATADDRRAGARPVHTMVMQPSGRYVLDHPCALSDIRALIENDPNLAQCNIISLRAFVMPWATAIAHGVAPHRFLMLELRLADEKLWLKLERRPDSKIALLRGLGRTAAKDEAWPQFTCYCSWRNTLTFLCSGSIPQTQSRNIVPKGILPRE